MLAHLKTMFIFFFTVFMLNCDMFDMLCIYVLYINTTFVLSESSVVRSPKRIIFKRWSQCQKSKVLWLRCYSNYDHVIQIIIMLFIMLNLDNDHVIHVNIWYRSSGSVDKFAGIMVCNEMRADKFDDMIVWW